MVGSPPREFHLLFDTGSDVTWVPCISCSGCPRTTGGVYKFLYIVFLLHAVISTMLHIYWYVSFMFHSLRSASMIMAAHRLRRWSVVNINCALTISRTQIKMRFLDTTYRIKSILTWLAGSLPLLSSLSLGKALILIFFNNHLFFTLNIRLDDFLGNRCTTYESGMIAWSPYKGVVGFGPGDASIISQLSSRGLTPKVFSHCLRRDDNGGGVLALGEIIDPRMVYTPLVPAM